MLPEQGFAINSPLSIFLSAIFLSTSGRVARSGI